MNGPDKDSYMRYVREEEEKRQLEHQERLLRKKKKAAQGAWVEKPMSAKRKAIPNTGRVDPGTMDATRKRETKTFTLRKISIQETVKRIMEGR